VNTAKAAAAINTIALGLGELAEALNESPVPVSAGDAGRVAVPPSAPAPFEESPFLPDEFPQPSLADESVEFADQGSEAVCPAHHKPFIDGKFGKYCPGKGIDPAWTNKRGYCTVNPGNVATYLRVKAAA
jgi:hypothetical protein